jgi:hypothetical protein
MSLSRWMTLLGALCFVAAGSAFAQSDSAHNPSSAISANESSSSSPGVLTSEDSAAPSIAEAALPAAPAPGGAAGQNNAGNANNSGVVYHLTFEGGFGANPPAGSTQKQYITWGYNFTVGGGYQFSQHLSALLEYQFIRDKLPGRLIAESGAQGGNAHIWSLSVDPVYDIAPKATNDVYAVGGGGFYRKVTNFTDPEQSQYCTYFYCGVGYVNQTVGHFSSNQGGWSVGGGYIHRMGGMYGDSRMKLFAEVRYLDVLSPAVTTQPNGLGTTAVAAGTKLIPITLGVRW